MFVPLLRFAWFIVGYKGACKYDLCRKAMNDYQVPDCFDEGKCLAQTRGGADIFKMSLEDKVERCLWTENFARTQMMDPSTNATLSLSSMPKRMLSLPSAKILRPWVSHGQPLVWATSKSRQCLKGFDSCYLILFFLGICHDLSCRLGLWEPDNICTSCAHFIAAQEL